MFWLIASLYSSIGRHHDIFSLPIAVSWITFNSIWYPLGVVLVFSIVQALEAFICIVAAKINALVIIIMITGRNFVGAVE
jgi:hypothetical protein